MGAEHGLHPPGAQPQESSLELYDDDLSFVQGEQPSVPLVSTSIEFTGDEQDIIHKEEGGLELVVESHPVIKEQIARGNTIGIKTKARNAVVYVATHPEFIAAGVAVAGGVLYWNKRHGKKEQS